MVAISALLFLLPGVAFAAPSPQSIGSDLTILTHNDLYGNTSTRQAATIVLDARRPHSVAQSSCVALGEELWNPGNASQGLDFLRYLDHGKPTDDIGVYWVGGGSGCKAITTHGEVQPVPCDTRLPALCSQSASYSSPAADDASLKWQTAVRTGNTTIVGYRDRLSFRFLGLKYASQPVRFSHSRYLPPSGGNISALKYGATCVQAWCSEPECSEDCLSLNIWTPYLPVSKSSSSKKKAVMLWIHGGGFTSGSGTDTTFDGGNIASRGDVVVVTINYRLSTLGFLALDHTTLGGNYGLADQNTALDWLGKHVEDFGGDKDRITVFGQSAGAASVRALLASPQAKGKFSGAIMQSNPAGVQYASTFSRYLTIQEATNRTEAILQETGCNQTDASTQLDCLRALDPTTLVGRRGSQWTGTIARYPVVDGTYLTSDELELGRFAAPSDVAVITGVMRDDGGPFSAFSGGNASQALVEQGFEAAEILESNRFPIPQGPNATLSTFNLTARVATDAMFRCLGQSTAVVGSENGVFPMLYAYEFDRAYQISEWSPNPPTCDAPVTDAHPHGDTSKPYFKCHSGELYYVFGTLIRQGRHPRDQDDVPFSQYIVDTWSSFARTKDPNLNAAFLHARGFANSSATMEGSSPWRPVDGKKSSRLRVLDINVRNEGFREVEQCAVLDFTLDYYAQ